jgi:hypothetical protein
MANNEGTNQQSGSNGTERVTGGTWERVNGGSWERVSEGSFGRISGGGWGRVSDGSTGRVGGETWGRVEGESSGRVDGGSWGRITDGGTGRVEGQTWERVTGGIWERTSGGSWQRISGGTATRWDGQKWIRVLKIKSLKIVVLLSGVSLVIVGLSVLLANLLPSMSTLEELLPSCPSGPNCDPIIIQARELVNLNTGLVLGTLLPGIVLAVAGIARLTK